MKCRWLQLAALAALLILGATAAQAAGGAYCNLRDLKITTLSNGVQIQISADGILSYRWEPNSQAAQWGTELTEVALRLPDARLTLDKTLYDVEQEPVATVVLSVPQDAQEGRGVVMTVSMTQPARVEARLTEDRQSLLLTVFSKRTVERGGRPGLGGEAAQEGVVSVTSEAGAVTVRAVKADIHKVVAEVARQGGLNVAIDDAVQHQVSLNLEAVKPLDVIKGIAAGYGLALSVMGDVYMLSEGVPTDLPTYRRSGTASFPMKYLKAADAASLLPTFLFKYVHDNPEQNAVVVTAPTQMLEKIGRDLHAIDSPPPMIMVECAVVELTDSNDLDRGFRWLYESPEYSTGTDAGTGAVDFHHVALDNGLATAIAETAKVRTWLQSLLTKGRAQVLAHPSMAAVNGKSAEIFIGAQRFIKMSYVVNGQLQERIETIPVGVRLNVSSWTGGNLEITSSLQVEVSNISQIDPETGVPRLGSRRATTTVRTHDGDTIVIGGLTQRQEELTVNRIPILGDLPIIGSLFRSKSSRLSNTELVLLVRPRLLDDSGRLPAAEDTGVRERFLQPGDLGYPETAPAPAP